MEKESWLSRDNGRIDYYNISAIDPKKNPDGIYKADNMVIICPEEFHRLVEGARLRKGRKRKIKRILIELED